jgi:ABC-type branched-subunit amino acid transport system substrate-binding protein
LDDGYEPDRATKNTHQLIEKDKVFALIGYVGTPTSYAVKPIVTEAKIPFFGAFTGAEGLRNPMNKYIFNIRASYYNETERLVDWLVPQSKKRIAVFYQNDSYGKAGLDGVQIAMKKHKLAIVALGTVERNTVGVDKAVKDIAAAKPDAVIMISAYKSCAAFIKAMNKTGLRPDYLNVSFVGSEALAEELGPDGQGVLISQVVPHPSDPAFSVGKEFSLLVDKYAKNVHSSFNTLEGYLVAKAFVEGLKRAGKDLTRDSLIAGLETMNKVELGNFPITFSPTNHNGSRYIGLAVIVGSSGNFMSIYEKQALPAGSR